MIVNREKMKEVVRFAIGSLLIVAFLLFGQGWAKMTTVCTTENGGAYWYSVARLPPLLVGFVGAGAIWIAGLGRRDVSLLEWLPALVIGLGTALVLRNPIIGFEWDVMVTQPQVFGAYRHEWLQCSAAFWVMMWLGAFGCIAAVRQKNVKRFKWLNALLLVAAILLTFVMHALYRVLMNMEHREATMLHIRLYTLLGFLSAICVVPYLKKATWWQSIVLIGIGTAVLVLHWSHHNVRTVYRDLMELGVIGSWGLHSLETALLPAGLIWHGVLSLIPWKKKKA